MQPGDDPLLEALDELVAAGRQNVIDWMALMTRADQVRDARRRGVDYVDMQLPGLSVIDAVTGNQERLAGAAARFRRVAARELHRSGLSVATIARNFGVTRQRVAALLSDSAPQDPPGN